MRPLPNFLPRLRIVLGWPGVCGLTALVAAVALFLVAVPPRQAELERLQAAHVAMPGARSAAVSGAASAPAQLRAFKSQFPVAAALPDWIERIEAASAAAGVRVERTDYRPAGHVPGGLERYEIALPVRGNYAQVRNYVATLLQTVPALAVTDLDLKRESIGAQTLEGRLNVVLFLQEARR